MFDPISLGIAAAAGGAQSLGSMFSSGANLYSAKAANDRAEEMYKHRYQWMVRDLVKAGLNPMLAVGGANPGAPPSMQVGTVSNPLEGASSNVQMAMRMKDELAILKSQKATAASDAVTAENRSLVSSVEAATASQARKAEIEATSANAQSARADARNKAADTNLRELDSRFYDTSVGKASRFIERILGSVRR